MADNSYHAPVGPEGQIAYSGADVGWGSNTAVAAGATVNGSVVVPSNGVRELAIVGELDQAGELHLVTFVDAAATVVLETTTTTLTASTPAAVFAPANHPFAAFRVDFKNTSASPATAAIVKAGLGQF